MIHFLLSGILVAVAAAPAPAEAKTAFYHYQAPAEKDTVYACPMHPEVRSDKPGECPICGMKLEKEEK